MVARASTTAMSESEKQVVGLGGSFPVVLPEFGLALVGGSEMAQRGGAGEVPAHAGAFQAAVHQAFACGLDFAGSDLPATEQVLWVVHAVLVAPDVAGQQTVGFALGGGDVRRIERFQFGQQGVLHEGGVSRRRLLGGCYFLGAAAQLSCALLTKNPWRAVLFTALSCFATQATQPLWWSSAIGNSGKHVGALFGLMNSAGVFGAMSSRFLVGPIINRLGGKCYSGRMKWGPIFYINVGVLIAAGLMWSSFRFVLVEPLEHST